MSKDKQLNTLKTLKNSVMRSFRDAKKNPDKYTKSIIGIAYTKNHMEKTFEEMESIIGSIHLLKNGIPKSEPAKEEPVVLNQEPNFEPNPEWLSAEVLE
jgi:hypothetical protein